MLTEHGSSVFFEHLKSLGVRKLGERHAVANLLRDSVHFVSATLERQTPSIIEDETISAEPGAAAPAASIKSLHSGFFEEEEDGSTPLQVSSTRPPDAAFLPVETYACLDDDLEDDEAALSVASPWGRHAIMDPASEADQQVRVRVRVRSRGRVMVLRASLPPSRWPRQQECAHHQPHGCICLLAHAGLHHKHGSTTGKCHQGRACQRAPSLVLCPPALSSS